MSDVKAQDSPTLSIISGKDGPYATNHMILLVEADPNLVWQIVGDWALAQLSSDFVESVTISGRAVGDTRTLIASTELGGAAIVERLEAYDPERRSYTYSFIDSGPLPWTGYTGTLSVQGHGKNRSIVLYEARIIPVGQSHAEAAAMSIANNRPWLLNLAERFKNARDGDGER